MRQTLFRILLDDLFAFQLVQPGAVDGSGKPIWIGWGDGLNVGIGWLLLPWALLMAFWFFIHRRNRLAAGHPTSIPWVWLVGFPIAVLFVAPRFAENLPNGIPVYGYGFMLFCAFIGAGWNATLRAQREGLPGEIIWDAGMWLFAGGIVGSRVFHLVQYWDKNFGDKHGFQEYFLQAINLSNGGMVLYGGVILGLVLYYVFCKRRGISPMYLADILTPSAFIGLAFGRTGCFLNGCCYGDACSLPWGVEYPANSVPYNAMEMRGILDSSLDITVPLHPSQLYSVMNAIVLYFLTSIYFKYRQQDGAVAALALMCYPFTRALLEVVRADELGQLNTGFTISQWISLGVALFGAGVIYYLRQQPKLVSHGVHVVQHSRGSSWAGKI